MMTRLIDLRAPVSSLLLLLCLLYTSAIINAQEPYKVAEIENPRCDLSEVAQIAPAPYGQFASVLGATPGARGAIVVSGLEGDATRYAERVKAWLINMAGVGSEQMVALYGGERATPRMELWIIPQGAAEPQFSIAIDLKKPQKFDTYGYWSGEYCGSERLPALSLLAETLKARAGWLGYIVVRPHRNRRGLRSTDAGWDPDSLSHKQALRRALSDRSYLTALLGVQQSRIKAIVGDNDDQWTHAEVWLVPPGVEPLLSNNSVKQR